MPEGTFVLSMFSMISSQTSVLILEADNSFGLDFFVSPIGSVSNFYTYSYNYLSILAINISLPPAEILLTGPIFTVALKKPVT